jgi:hypothetical protein
MSPLTALSDVLTMPVPAWIALVAIGGLYAVQHLTVARRIDSHARILGHLDRWANSVELRLEELGQGMDSLPAAPRRAGRPPVSARKHRADFGNLSNEQVRALISRLIGTRAA